jgi:hypothetical protein
VTTRAPGAFASFDALDGSAERRRHDPRIVDQKVERLGSELLDEGAHRSEVREVEPGR